ncbi:N-acetylgalactosamine-N,N'-diacetylbacillosaminyl-diphospho-undecaprenol 4-alpha-N-acetylgalactosaminyltransferase [Streptomyces sp. YIM 130001]|uniref:glycosyltransferase family 4 protein n=1 Tax=Streptomyces sp. YIM 130001 TaxID=2259644 RepID=UPI000E65CCDF|nr:glycosyltransferase family 4 protein [Streptomyces sp. YIM 130001]RII18882.1 N-acetylgalactosamine-N,N'-diacetylbacillosaminyl-diphospho-undecaprenol 4-alpha-N-acetylgalactosaminyltransferase [Streptomyces sp. YIM 130001]
MHISFLIHNAYGIGGTIRTTYNLANTLAEQHDVEIVSVHRHRDAPVFAPSDRVRVRHLVDQRKGTAGYEGDSADHRRPARHFPSAEGRFDQYSELTDQRLAHHLATTDADVVIGTRPGLNVHLARQTRHGPLRIGQEHLTLDSHSRALRSQLRAVYPRLDALTTTTEADAAAYRRRMRLPGVRVQALPNPVPVPGVAPTDGSGKWVVAAGRLAPVKRYDLLVRAFDQVRRERPDWRLRIYGGGVQKDRLRSLIDELGLYNHVFLMGPAHPIDPEWAKGSIAAVTSSLESFGMTIVEAMRCGLPVVSTNCPHGPGEIIDNGVDGRLVPVGDVPAISRGLLELINDDPLRERMSHAALADSERFDPTRIADRYESLFHQLVANGRRGSRLGRMRGSLHRARGALLGGAYVARDAGRTALNRRGTR